MQLLHKLLLLMQNLLYLATINNPIDFFHFNLFKSYWKCFSIILSFSSYLLGENKLIYSNKVLLFNIKWINPIQKHPHIIESHACMLTIFVIFLLPINVFNFFCIMLNSKAIEICHIITIHIESYPMSFYWFILIKINYLCIIRYFR